MKKIKFSPEERSALVESIQTYFREELEQDIGAIPAELLMQFFAEEMAGYFYNRGLYDSQAVLMKEMDNITDAIYSLEQKTKLVRG